VAQRHEEGVLRVPGVVAGARLDVRDVRGVVGLRRPVVLARVDDIGAAAAEPLVEQRLPGGDPAHLAEQVRPGGVVAVNRRDPEVVPRAAIEVDDDGAVAERLGDRAGDRGEQLGQVALDAHESRDLEERSKW
jgi:hypothetical protein